MQLSLGITLALAAGAVVGFEVKEEGDYDTNYRSRVSKKGLSLGLTKPEKAKIFTSGTTPDTTILGMPMAVARSAETPTVIVGNPHYDTTDSKLPTLAAGQDIEKGGFVDVRSFTDGKWQSDLKGALPLSKNLATANGMAQTINASTFIDYTTAEAFPNADEADGSTPATFIQSVCTHHVGLAVAISDDGNTFAYTCKKGVVTSGDSTGSAAKTYVVVARYDSTLKPSRFKFAEIEDPLGARADNSWAKSIALSGDGNTLVIGDPENDVVYVYHHTKSAVDEAKCNTANPYKWNEGCKAVHWQVFGNAADTLAKGGWYNTNGDRMALRDQQKTTTGLENKIDDGTAAKATITIPSTTGLVAGMIVTTDGSGIPTGTKVFEVVSDTSIKLDQATTADVAVGKTLTFTSDGRKPKTQEDLLDAGEEKFGWSVAVDEKGKHIAVSSLREGFGSEDYGMIRVYKKRASDGWFRGNNKRNTHVQAALTPTEFDEQLIFSHQIADQTKSDQLLVDISSDGAYVAFSSPNGENPENDDQDDNSGVVAICTTAEHKISDDNKEKCQYANGEENDKIGLAMNSLSLSGNGKIVAVGAPEANTERRRMARSLHRAEKYHHSGAGYVFTAERSDKKDAKELKSHSFRTDMESDTEDGQAGHGVGCAYDCNTIFFNDNTNVKGGIRMVKDDEGNWWFEDGLWLTIFLPVVGVVGGAIIATKATGTGLFRAGAPMGYAAADNHM